MKPYFKHVIGTIVIAMGLISSSAASILLDADIVARIKDMAYETPASLEITISMLVVLVCIIALLVYRFYPGSEKKESDQSE